MSDASARAPNEEPHGYCTRCATALVARWQEDRFRPTCPGCGLIQYLDPKVAVAVMVGDASRILLGRRAIDPGLGGWSFPAGYVNRGEVLEEAAAREALEEMGISVRVERLVGVYSSAGNPVVLVAYTATVLEGDPRPDGQELSDVGWFAPSDLPAMAFPRDTRIVADWLRL